MRAEREDCKIMRERRLRNHVREKIANSRKKERRLQDHIREKKKIYKILRRRKPLINAKKNQITTLIHSHLSVTVNAIMTIPKLRYIISRKMGPGFISGRYGVLYVCPVRRPIRRSDMNDAGGGPMKVKKRERERERCGSLKKSRKGQKEKTNNNPAERIPCIV
jgi:hypothetical protein